MDTPEGEFLVKTFGFGRELGGVWFEVDCNVTTSPSQLTTFLTKNSPFGFNAQVIIHTMGIQISDKTGIPTIKICPIVKSVIN